MRLRQTIRITIRAADRESLGTLNTLKIAEVVQAYTRCARSEAEQLGTLVAREGLERAAPPDNDWIGAGVAGVAVVFSDDTPLINVDVRRARDQQL